MILVSYGTRPEWIKVKTIIQKLKDEGYPVLVLFTGQQKDIGEFEYDVDIKIQDHKTNRLNNIVTTIMCSGVFHNISHVIVQGDTASSFAVALSAFNLNIPISHIEAGLRTYDKQNPYPEESYRQMISCMADYHFVPTEQDRENLITEKKNGEVHVVGNTVIDTLPELETKYDNIVLVTMHRRENLDNMSEWFYEIEKLATDNPQLEFILPLHPNPRVQEKAKVFKNVTTIDPLDHDKLLQLIATSKLIITDSGGIQEEAAFYGKKVLICRKVTERPAEGQTLIHEPNDLSVVFDREIENFCINSIECPFGDGHTSNKIMEILKCVI